MELYVARKGSKLVLTEGRVFADSDVPDFLREVRAASYMYGKKFFTHGCFIDIPGWERMKSYLHTCSSGKMYGLWSGMRSALVHDSKTKKWYRLKGIALDPEDPLLEYTGAGMYHILGGQEKYSAEFEEKMSRRFNKILRNEGIEPVMNVKGMWKYPVLAGRTRPVASIIEVGGDTRLDEFTYALGVLLYSILSKRTRLRSILIGRKKLRRWHLYKHSENLFLDFGFAIGGLMRLLHKSGQTWNSDNRHARNSHWGNVVLYGEEKLKVGLVDFDSSCDTLEFSKSKIESIQKRDYDDVIASFSGDGIISQHVSEFLYHSYCPLKGLRDKLIQGFITGYIKKKVNTTMDFGRFEDFLVVVNKTRAGRAGTNGKLEDRLMNGR